MQVSRSGYYSWRTRESSLLEKERSRLIRKVRAIHQQTRGSYGARRISEELRAECESCGRTKATTLMNLAGVKAKQKKKYKVTTNSEHNLPVAPNLLERNFYVSEPDRVYCSDITYIWTTEGWLYLAIILDLFSRRFVKVTWQWCRLNRHHPIDEQHRELCIKLRGYYQYYAVRYNSRAFNDVLYHVRCAWRYWLSRRCDKGKVRWDKFDTLLARNFPLPFSRIIHKI